MKVTKMLNCKFTTEELKDIGIKLALANQRLERLEDDKKQSQSQFKSDIDAANAEIKSLAQKLARGSEDRNVDCDVLYNTPNEGKKTIRRNDTGEIVQIQIMTNDELNDLFINNLGAQKENSEFVFRDKTRCKMISFADFKNVAGHEKFEKIDDGYYEEELVDAKPEDIELALVVYDLDPQTKKDIFEVYRFSMIPDNQTVPPKNDAQKMLAERSEIIDAEPADDQEAGK